ncbi:hypothetical protein V5F53_03035 [Xanthobacter sp. V4C-4]|uniref:hypothetical protein n=1 Tax=Xanthobacter cornucopiae TaxID=3119924 RepID=UPI0037266C9D
MQSSTITFPAFKAKQIRVGMSGNGWFLFERATFFVEGCSNSPPREGAGRGLSLRALRRCTARPGPAARA